MKLVITKDKDVVDQKSIEDVKYNQSEQVSMLQNTQDEYLSYMSKVMSSTRCPKCGGQTKGISQLMYDFHSVYTKVSILAHLTGDLKYISNSEVIIMEEFTNV